MKNRLIFSLVGMLFGVTAISQQIPDYSEMFKMQLFTELSVVTNDHDFVAKNANVFSIVNSSTNVTLHPLKSEGFHEKFLFFEVDATKGKDIEYNESEYRLNLLIGWGSKYIFCIDTSSFILYRITGFNGSDFWDFLEVCQDKQRLRSFNINKFVKNHKVDNVNFKCIYKGLRAKKYMTHINILALNAYMALFI